MLTIETLNPIITALRLALAGQAQHLSKLNLPALNQPCELVYITLFQSGIKPLRWGSKKANLKQTLLHNVQRLQQHPRFAEFNPSQPDECRILFEQITQTAPCDIRQLTCHTMHSPNRFEPGVNGLQYTYQGITRYFMPTDAYTQSIMSVKQLLNHLAKKTGLAKHTTQISERVKLMRREPIDYKLIESRAFISYQDKILPLHRGIPQKTRNVTKQVLKEHVIKSVGWLLKNQNPDGSFLYFYDAIKDSVVDDMHPNMINPLYNNILRHSGGTITLLRAYEIDPNPAYLSAAKKSIAFLISTFRYRQIENHQACYPFFNKKSKLGGAGIGLVAIMLYQKLSKDTAFADYATGLVRHILSQVLDDGEMQGYYIHPQFNQGHPIVNPDEATRSALFSFYYPGEALLGLALYAQQPDLVADFKAQIIEKSRLALDFLVTKRPIKYHHLFTPLPADAWLMQAIEEWVKFDDMQHPDYVRFVLDDTAQMFKQMYTEDNVTRLTRDYVGGFFYHYGDHVYHDASRCEGIVSAYYLCRYLKRDQEAEAIMQRLKLSSQGILLTFFDEASVYCHKKPKKALHSFRFKLTRQWVRVDSVQHAACFFARLYHQLDL